MAVPDFVPGQYGMDIVIRGPMDDTEWRRWVAISQTAEIKQMIFRYKKEHDLSGLHDAICEFLSSNGIMVKGETNA